MTTNRDKARDAIEGVLEASEHVVATAMDRIESQEGREFARTLILTGLDAYSRMKMTHEGATTDAEAAAAMVSIIVHSPDIFFSLLTLATTGLGRIFDSAHRESLIEIIEDIYANQTRGLESE